jgi:hypothetical protein
MAVVPQVESAGRVRPVAEASDEGMAHAQLAV